MRSILRHVIVPTVHTSSDSLLQSSVIESRRLCMHVNREAAPHDAPHAESTSQQEVPHNG